MLLMLLQPFVLALALSLALAAKWRLARGKAIGGALIAGGGAALASTFVPAIGVTALFLVQLAVAALLLAAMLLFFFHRDPERVPPSDENAVLSPADGQVLYVKNIPAARVPTSYKHGFPLELEELAGSSMLEEGAYLIGIAMNLLDVHVNRAPIRGDVVLTRMVKGRALSLRRPEALLTNTRLTTVIEGGGMAAAVIQITSRLVRHIEPYISGGDLVEAGQRIGMIRFGSQVDVLLPKRAGLRVVCGPRQRVRAGEAIIARHVD